VLLFLIDVRSQRGQHLLLGFLKDALAPTNSLSLAVLMLLMRMTVIRHGQAAALLLTSSIAEDKLLSTLVRIYVLPEVGLIWGIAAVIAVVAVLHS